MSYLVSALSADEIDDVLAAAHASLRPGGLLVVHDFLLDDDRPGPATTALWFLQYLAWQPDALVVHRRRAGRMAVRMRASCPARRRC